MAKHVDIHFGPDDKTILGDTIPETIEMAKQDYETRTGHVPSEAVLKSITRNVSTQKGNEKELLIAALNTYATKIKKELDALVECGRLIDKVKKADIVVEFTDHEIKMIKEAIPKMENIGGWTRYFALLEQISEPKYKEDKGNITERKE